MISGLTGIWQAYRQPDAWEERSERDESAARSAERVTSQEAKWLADRLQRYGELRDHEVALIEFLSEESTEVDPALRLLMDRVRVG